jgi:hypothetical protein
MMYGRIGGRNAGRKKEWTDRWINKYNVYIDRLDGWEEREVDK